jgi:4-amino-4-deoxy-L-arabinose transferase-like glycosyltransferase
MSGRRPLLSRMTLTSIIFLYCILGFAYAVETPRWQTPDEPAHYNYVAYLAENRRFPVLQMGDYPHEYLEEIKAAGFPPEMSIEPIRYEFHQPPLYYALAAVVYRLASPLGFDGQFLLLRLFSVLLGAILLLVVYAIVREICPRDLFLPLVATTFIATLPMHIAMSAAINNDTLAEVILALVFWLCLKEIRGGLSRRQLVALGVLVALALLTKTTIYAPVILVPLVALGASTPRRGWHAFLRRVGSVFGLGLVLSSWWFVRNVLTYGGLDLFAWQRHDSIVVGQPTTAGWIAQHGLSQTIQGFFVVSFRSFWAQFGWMGVLIDSRLYLLLAVVSVAVFAGFVLWLWRVVRKPASLGGFQRWALLLLLLVFLLVSAAHISYNLKFVQHQGRYLFPALVPIGLAFALGLSEWVLLAARLMARLPLPRRVHASLPAIFRSVVFFLLCLGFALLDLGCLYLFIVPQLRR